MKTVSLLVSLLLLFSSCKGSYQSSDAQPVQSEPIVEAEGEWINLFDGESLNGWRASENKETFSVKDGVIVVDGPRSHLFYVGDVEGHDFKNFEFKADVMTKPGANSGMYFHTEYQEEGWPSKGYEVQVNNSSGDWRRTSSLYAIDDVREAPAKDDEWFTQKIIVRDKRIVILVNGNVQVDYTEPDDADRPNNMSGRRVDRGTFALQGHDPESVIFYKNIMVKPLD
ncbi:MAG: DUF1080 domain-containing protein [Rhodothermaceae bacterium]|nr:DUF1080 domain-containing protein [Rhodothermaceae bacterium]